jgi:hypothetical protein
MLPHYQRYRRTSFTFYFTVIAEKYHGRDGNQYAQMSTAIADNAAKQAKEPQEVAKFFGNISQTSFEGLEQAKSAETKLDTIASSITQMITTSGASIFLSPNQRRQEFI